MRNRIQVIIAIAMMAMSLPNLHAASSTGDAQPSRQTEVDASSTAEPVDGSSAGDKGGSASAAPEGGGPDPSSGAAQGEGPSAMPIESDEMVGTGKLMR